MKRFSLGAPERRAGPCLGVKSRDDPSDAIQIGSDLVDGDRRSPPALTVTHVSDQVAAFDDALKRGCRTALGYTAAGIDSLHEVLLADEAEKLADLRRSRASSPAYLKLNDLPQAQPRRLNFSSMRR